MKIRLKNKVITVKRSVKILLSIVLLLVVVRIFLPQIILHYANQYLYDKVEGYTGHINDFDLSLYRGAYQIEGLTFEKKSGKVKTPFIELKKADISIAWRPLFKGHVLANLKIDSPKLNIVDSANKSKKQLGVEVGSKDLKENENVDSFVDVYNKLVPMNLESLRINNGELHFKNLDNPKAPIDVFLNKATLEALNIHNSKGESKALISTYKFEAMAQNHAKVKSNGSFNILTEPMAFDVNAQIVGLSLQQLNPFLLSYVPFTFEKGWGSLYAEVATKNNKVAGYVKPVFTDAKLVGNDSDFISLKHFAYEIGIGAANAFFKNSSTKTTATKLEFSGPIDNPKFKYWDAFKESLRHAFGSPSVKEKIDNEINLKSVDKKN